MLAWELRRKRRLEAFQRQRRAEEEEFKEVNLEINPEFTESDVTTLGEEQEGGRISERQQGNQREHFTSNSGIIFSRHDRRDASKHPSDRV